MQDEWGGRGAYSPEEQLERANAEREAAEREVATRRVAEQRLAVQFEVSRVLAEAESLDRSAPTLLRSIGLSLAWDFGVVWVVAGDGNVLRPASSWRADTVPESAAADLMAATFVPGVGLPGRVWAHGAPAWIADIAADTNFPRRDQASRAGMRSALAFPIRGGTQVHGVIEFFARTPRAPDEELLRTVGTIGNQIGQFLERQRALDALRASESLKAAILDTSLDCVITIDAEGRVTEFNAAAERTFGYRRDEVLGRLLADLIVPPAYREAHLRGIERYVATGEPRLLGRRLELPAVRADGSEFPAELAILRLPTPGPPLFTGFLRDITERRRTEQERAQLLERERALRAEAEEARRSAEAANRAKSEFLTRMSHELRTPLNAIAGYVDLLDLGIRGPVTDEQREDLARIRRSEEHLLGLINDVLNFAKLEAGQVQYQIVDFDLDSLLASVEAMIAPQLGAKRLRYEYRPGPGPVIVRADREKLLQVVLNLLSNAVKFTPEEGLVHLDWELDGDVVRIHVCDTGIGIPADRYEAVFEPFVQVDPSLTRRREGTGLGLAISRDLARGMGGDLTVRSREGEGSIFTVTVPRVRSAGAASGNGAPAAEREASGTS